MYDQILVLNYLCKPALLLKKYVFLMSIYLLKYKFRRNINCNQRIAKISVIKKKKSKCQ